MQEYETTDTVPISEFSQENFRYALNETLHKFCENQNILITDEIALIIVLPDKGYQFTFDYKLVRHFFFEYEMAVHRAFHEFIAPLIKQNDIDGIEFQWYYKRVQDVPAKHTRNASKRDREVEEIISNKRLCV